MTQKGVGFSPDITAETEDHIANQGVFAGEVLVEGFFTNPELGRDGVHGDSAVTAGQKIGAGLAKNAVAELVTGGGRRDTRNFDGDGHCYLRNYNRFLSFSKQFLFYLGYLCPRVENKTGSKWTLGSPVDLFCS